MSFRKLQYRISGSAQGQVTHIGVTWEVEVNWYVSDWSDGTEIDDAYITGIVINGNVQSIQHIHIDVSELNQREYDSLLLVADEDRVNGYDDSDADRAYDNWKANQL